MNYPKPPRKNARKRQERIAVQDISAAEAAPASVPSFGQMRGVAKSLFRKLGGAEAFLRAERRAFCGSDHIRR